MVADQLICTSRVLRLWVLEIGGRHDPCIVQRAVPVFEAALAIAVYDALLDSDNWEDMER